MRLAELGWDAAFAEAFHNVAAASKVASGADVASASDVVPGPDLASGSNVASDFSRKPHDLIPARVAIEFNHNYRVYTENGELDATATGRLKHRATSRSQLPAVGDWVAVRKRPDQERGAIVAVLPRRSWFSRRMAGQVTDEQVVAANVDVIFIVMGLDADFSVRRLERYLLLARESGARPVVLLTKPDLSSDVAAQATQVRDAAGDVAVHVVSPRYDQGMEHVAAALQRGRTGALLGSSGVGKSTIINRLVGQDVQKTREVRTADSRGRHTTTHRELVLLPGGGLLVDTPGMRELQLWDVSEAVRETFDDVEALAASCHFTDCRHRDEPRCAVKAAVGEGRLAADRLESYLKLQEELASLARQQDEKAMLERKRQGRRSSKVQR
jgi:ribosome biogenesis GTPase / thiamine phosphate phosphatase